MSWWLIALQVGTGQPNGQPNDQPNGQPNEQQPPDQPADQPPTPVSPQPPTPVSPQPPVPQPGHPPGAPPPTSWGPSPYRAPPAGGFAERPLPEPERDVVHWFARMSFGLGPRGFAENNALLESVGYGAPKLWATIDAAWMFHRYVGAGVVIGMNRLYSRGSATGFGRDLSLNEYAMLVGAELPIMLLPERLFSVYVTPKAGFAAGKVEIGNFDNVSYLETGFFGATVGVATFTYHLGSSVTWLYAPAGPPGDLGRNHDFGGIYFTLDASIDG
jgi:hypothetical protein